MITLRARERQRGNEIRSPRERESDTSRAQAPCLREGRDIRFVQEREASSSVNVGRWMGEIAWFSLA